MSSSGLSKWRKMKNARKSIIKLKMATANAQMIDEQDVDATSSVDIDLISAKKKRSNKGRRGSQLQMIFQAIDEDNSGEIDSNEFMTAMKGNQQVRKFFGLSEADDDTEVAEQYFEKMFKSIDDNGDENITYEEFEQHIAQMALKSIITLRKDFDSTLGAEKQRINEKLSKMAAKQINKSQKKLEKTLKKLEDGEKKLEQYEGKQKEFSNKQEEYEHKLNIANEKIKAYELKYEEDKEKPITMFYQELFEQHAALKRKPQSTEIVPGMLEIMILNATELHSVKHTELRSEDTKMNPYVSIEAPWIINGKELNSRRQTTLPAKDMDRNPKWDDSHNNILQFDLSQSHILYKSALISEIIIRIMDDDTNMTSVDDVICEAHFTVDKYLQTNSMKWESIRLDMVHRVNHTNENTKAGILNLKIRHVATASQNNYKMDALNEKMVGAYILRNRELCKKIGLPDNINKPELQIAFEVLDEQKTITSLDDFELFLLRFPGRIASNFIKRYEIMNAEQLKQMEIYKQRLQHQLDGINTNTKKKHESIEKIKEKYEKSLASLEAFSIEDKEKSIRMLKQQHEKEKEDLQQQVVELTLEKNEALQKQKEEHEKLLKISLQKKEMQVVKSVQAIGNEKLKESENQLKNTKQLEEVKRLKEEMQQLTVLKNRSEREVILALEENKKLDHKINVLTATIKDLEHAHSNVESEIVMETKVNTILIKAQNVMIAFSNGEPKDKCRIDMEHLLHEFDRSSRKLLDIHDEAHRHMSFVRSKLEHILTMLGGTGHNTHFRTSDRHFIPKRNHRQPPMAALPSRSEATGRLSTSDLCPPKLKVNTTPWQPLF